MSSVCIQSNGIPLDVFLPYASHLRLYNADSTLLFFFSSIQHSEQWWFSGPLVERLSEQFCAALCIVVLRIAIICTLIWTVFSSVWTTPCLKKTSTYYFVLRLSNINQFQWKLVRMPLKKHLTKLCKTSGDEIPERDRVPNCGVGHCTP